MYSSDDSISQGEDCPIDQKAQFWVSEVTVSFRHLNPEEQICHYVSMIGGLVSPYLFVKGKKQLQKVNQHLVDTLSSEHYGERFVQTQVRRIAALAVLHFVRSRFYFFFFFFSNFSSCSASAKSCSLPAFFFVAIKSWSDKNLTSVPSNSVSILLS